MRQRVAQRELAVEVLLVLARRRGWNETTMSAWWRCGPDERLRVGLAAVELGEHLVGRVAAPRAVALHLPVAAQLLRRVEVDAHVELSRELRVWRTRAAPR